MDVTKPAGGDLHTPKDVSSEERREDEGQRADPGIWNATCWTGLTGTYFWCASIFGAR